MESNPSPNIPDHHERMDVLRELMGTLPGKDQPAPKQRFVSGVKDIKVELIPGSYPTNPYRAMYAMATTCWGTRGSDGHYAVDKWPQTLPEHRFMVVKAVLSGQALPLALESPTFAFAVSGPSRAAFDQIARARVGIVFSARGMRDNSWEDAQFRIPSALSQGDGIMESVATESMITSLKAYKAIMNSGKGTWQAARAVMPMNVVYAWSMSMNLMAMMNLLSNRLKFCEQEDTVAVAWLVRERMKETFPLLASYLRPGCDRAKSCVYHKDYTLSEAFGCLFRGCGRWPDTANAYQEFNESSSEPDLIARDLGIDVISIVQPIEELRQLKGTTDWGLFHE